jgi:hypothetical protein
MSVMEGSSPIDRLMERASRALEATRYFEAERFCKDALRRAHEAADFERMARIVLPLQEARRQKRQLAIDADRCVVLGDSDLMMACVQDILPGCYLFQPPLLGIDARNFREEANGRGIPTLVLCREPLTRDGKWPLVGVGQVSIRVRVDPPVPLERVEKRVTKDAYDGSVSPDHTWFESAAEALGDAAIAKIKPEDPAAWRVDDLINALSAHPDHEKLHQRLEEACRQALTQELPEGHRHRPLASDPFSF